jgi:hypothetical protein
MLRAFQPTSTEVSSVVARQILTNAVKATSLCRGHNSFSCIRSYLQDETKTKPLKGKLLLGFSLLQGAHNLRDHFTKFSFLVLETDDGVRGSTLR